ncbi:MAG: thioredoxin domain-containing protein, partial [Terriglobales bacterium]
SQDADINLDDDGDYFTWTLEEARAALNEEELKVAQPYYDINEAGEMHHNPAKNVLFVHASVEEIGVRTGMQRDRISALLDSAKDKMYAARLKRATPFVDKTVYVGWNALCVSAYLDAARVLSLEDARHFALRSLDRILSQGFTAEGGLKHVIAYADPQAPNRNVAGVLDDYAFTALACLDGYEATADLSYFTFARKIVDAMIERFYDQTSGGFFDSENKAALGALTARRKPFQDSPTPAGNSAAAIALFRMHAYTHEDSYREKAEDTLEVFAGMAEQYGMFAATYALAAVWLLEGHTQVVVVGNDERARELYAAAVAPFAVNKAVVKVSDSAAAPQNLPPVLAETVPNIPAVKDGKSTAVLCSNFTCQPPISDPDELAKVLHETLVAKAA